MNNINIRTYQDGYDQIPSDESIITEFTSILKDEKDLEKLYKTADNLKNEFPQEVEKIEALIRMSVKNINSTPTPYPSIH